MTFEGRTFLVVRMDEHLFEVRPAVGRTYCVVDLARRTCSCGKFQEKQFPCVHACAGAVQSRLRAEDFVHASYATHALRQVYAGVVVPVDAATVLADGTTGPPGDIRQAGRPRKLRLRGRGEVDPAAQVTCSRCLRKGHNARTCDRRPQ